MNAIYVSPNGNDKNGSGTHASPFATPAYALEQSRKAEKPCTVFFAQGIYCINKPLVLTGRDSGITLLGENETVFTGAKPIGSLNFKQHGNGIFKAEIKLNPFDRLFADGKEQLLCRYPNYCEGKIPLDGAASPQEIKKRCASYRNPETGFVRAIHNAQWGGNSYTVLGKDSTSPCGLKLKWVGDNNRGDGYGKHMVIENIFEELDAPGEWFYDYCESALYWYPPDGVNPDYTKLSVANSTELLQITGTDEHHAADITIKNITFTKTGRTLFPVRSDSKPYVPLLRGDWCVVRSGAVYIENADNCTVADCCFSDLGGNGLFLYGHNGSHKITHNYFNKTGATAIQIVGDPDSVYQPSFWEHKLYPELPVHLTEVKEPDKTGPRCEKYPREIIIEENHIEQVGMLEKQSSGINLSVSSKISILHNTIHNSSRSLININDGTFGGHKIAYNDLFDAQRETADHGPFNSWGRDRFWSVSEYNASGKFGKMLREYEKDGELFDITQIDACKTTHIHCNRFHHDPKTTHSWGIDLDDGSSNYEIDGNLVLGTGIKLREGFDRRVHHNLIIDGQLNIHVPYEQCRDKIYHNLIFHKTPVATAGCSTRRFRASQISLTDNFAYAGTENIRLPKFIKGVSQYKPDNGAASELPLTGEWKSLLNASYGQTDCTAKSPAYLPDFGKSEEEISKWISGARCCNVTNAVRSSNALPDNNGIYVKKILPFTKAARAGLRKHDVIIKSGDTSADIGLRRLSYPLTVRRKNRQLILK